MARSNSQFDGTEGHLETASQWETLDQVFLWVCVDIVLIMPTHYGWHHSLGLDRIPWLDERERAS